MVADGSPLHKTKTGTVTMYHATDRVAAKAILDERWFYRGYTGMLGGGIYFSSDAEGASRKRRRHNDNGEQGPSVVLAVRVDMGTTGVWRRGTDLRWSDFEDYGVESAKVDGLDSYMILDSDQILDIVVHSGKITDEEEEDSWHDQNEDSRDSRAPKRRRIDSR
ncbi:unnamed protein product [Amoebophrya sp. A25]|nr:unnamed protein product [Amoebophrya sp. A25]|eukprot:GSA25T00026182001.1